MKLRDSGMGRILKLIKMELQYRLAIIHWLAMTRCEKGPLYANSDGELFRLIELVARPPKTPEGIPRWMIKQIEDMISKMKVDDR